MRGIKGIRKNDVNKTKINLMIALSWYTSLMNRLHINVEEIVWERFQYLCSYCGHCPCVCLAEKVKARRKVVGKVSEKPTTVGQYQKMFGEIYPATARTPKDAALHLAEETGELSEAFHIYMGNRDETELKNVYLEAADFFSCIMGVLNSLKINSAEELARTFTHNCHVCRMAPCICTFEFINTFKS